MNGMNNAIILNDLVIHIQSRNKLYQRYNNNDIGPHCEKDVK